MKSRRATHNEANCRTQLTKSLKFMIMMINLTVKKIVKPFDVRRIQETNNKQQQKIFLGTRFFPSGWDHGEG